MHPLLFRLFPSLPLLVPLPLVTTREFDRVAIGRKGNGGYGEAEGRKRGSFGRDENRATAAY